MRRAIFILLTICAFSFTTQGRKLHGAWKITSEEANAFKKELISNGQKFIKVLEAKKYEIQEATMAAINKSSQSMKDIWLNGLYYMEFNSDCYSQSLEERLFDIIDIEEAHENTCKDNATAKLFSEVDFYVKGIQSKMTDLDNDLKSCVEFASSYKRLRDAENCSEFNAFITNYERKQQFHDSSYFYIEDEDKVDSVCFRHIYNEYRHNFERSFALIVEKLIEKANVKKHYIIEEANTCSMTAINAAFMEMSNLSDVIKECNLQDSEKQTEEVDTEMLDIDYIDYDSREEDQWSNSRIESSIEEIAEEMGVMINKSGEIVTDLFVELLNFLQDHKDYNVSFISLFEEIRYVEHYYETECKENATKKLFSNVETAISAIIRDYDKDLKTCVKSSKASKSIKNANCFEKITSRYEQLIHNYLAITEKALETTNAEIQSSMIEETNKCSQFGFDKAYEFISKLLGFLKVCEA